MPTTTKTLTPRAARTEKELNGLKYDNKTVRGHWLLVDETKVHLAAQKMGEPPTAEISIPRSIWDALVDWYNGG